MLGWTCRTLLLSSALLVLRCDAFLPKGAQARHGIDSIVKKRTPATLPARWGPCEAKNPFGPGYTEGTCMRLLKCKDTLRGIARLNFPALCGVEFLSTIVCCPIMNGDQGGPTEAENRGPSITNPLNLLGDVFQQIPGIVSAGIGSVHAGGGQGNVRPNPPQQRPHVPVPDKTAGGGQGNVRPNPPQQRPHVPVPDKTGDDRPEGMNPSPPRRPQVPGQGDKGGYIPGGVTPTPPQRPQVPARGDKDGSRPGRPCKGLQCPTEDSDDIIHLIDPRKGRV